MRSLLPIVLLAGFANGQTTITPRTATPPKEMTAPLTNNPGIEPMPKQDDVAQSGLSLLVPPDPAYAMELKRLGFDDAKLQEKGLFPVILKNQSSRALVSVSINWKVADGTGFVRSPSLNYFETTSLRDGHLLRSAKSAMPAASTRLLTVRGFMNKPEEIANAMDAPSLLRDPHALVSVVIDSAIFEDGTAVGPDQNNFIARVRASVDAKQDLVEEINSKLSQGKSLHDILAAIPREQTDWTKTEPEDFYRKSRQDVLAELVSAERDYGEERARSSLQYHKYEVRPTIHRIVSGPKN